MCGEGVRDVSPKEKLLQQVAALMEHEEFTVEQLKTLCKPGVLRDLKARLSGANAHEKS